MGNVELLQLALEAGQLGLPLLVELNLGRGVRASSLKTRGDVLNILLEHGTALLSLRPISTLYSQFLVQLLQSGLELLGLLGVLGSQSCLVIDLGGQSTSLLILPCGSSLQLSLDTLQVRDGFLGQLQVTLDLPLSLINTSLDLLLTLQSIFSLIKSLFQLTLDTGQMIALVLSSLDIPHGFLTTVSNSSLLLTKLGDHLSLVRDLILQGADLVVLVGSVLLSLG